MGEGNIESSSFQKGKGKAARDQKGKYKRIATLFEIQFHEAVRTNDRSETISWLSNPPTSDQCVHAMSSMCSSINL